MDKIKPILIVFFVIAAVIAACSLSASGLLDRTSHTLDSASLFKAMDVMQAQTSTINKLTDVLTMQNAAIIIVAMAVLAFAFYVIRAMRAVESRPALGSLLPAGGLRFLSLDLPRAQAAIHRLDFQKKQLLLNQLYVICSILEGELGYGQQVERLPAVKQNDSVFHWG